jgi:hypothetical protein
MKKTAENKDNLVIINVAHLRLKPPAHLNELQAAVWRHVVDHSEPAAFKQRESPLLEMYCTSVCLSRIYAGKIGSEGDDGRYHWMWADSTRVAATLATRLRLSPQSRYDARAAERHSETTAHMPPWDKYQQEA